MVKTITKKDISNYLNSALGFTKQESKQLVEHFLEEIKIALIKGEEVKLSGFGNFIIHHKNQIPYYISNNNLLICMNFGYINPSIHNK